MKKYYYHFLMILCSILFYNSLYYVMLFGVIYYGIIPILYVDIFLGYALSPEVFILVSIGAMIFGYQLAKKWWKIIYVDGVYHFHSHHKHHH